MAALTAATLTSLVLLSGCSAPSFDPDVSMPAGGAAPAAPAEDRGVPKAPATRAPQAPGKTGATVPQAPAPAERKIIRTAEITLAVGDLEKAAADVRGAASASGGYVSNEQIVMPKPGSRWWSPSTMTVRVPSESLDKTLDALTKVGEVQGRTVSSDDVTEQLVDIDSRIKTMRESIARLQKLMERAGSVADIASIESQLTARQAELESLLAQQKSLGSAVAESTVTVKLQPKDAPPAPNPPNPFVEGLAGGWYAFLSSISVLLTAIGALLPFAVAGGLIAWPIVAWRRRVKAKAPAKPAPAAQPPLFMPAAPSQQTTPPQQEAPAPAEPDQTPTETTHDKASE